MAVTSKNYQIVLDAKINTATLNKQISSLSKTVKMPDLSKVGTGASTSAKQVNSLYKNMNMLNSTIAVVRGLTNAFSELSEPVFELNKAVIEYQKVSDLAGDSMDAFIDSASRAGEVVARTA